ncbi:hypothetical protein RMSM_03492 [Rhodopirellula maiorica SM1]|uniref:Uncharacterized protein n=1 Tax=Rhodopirellula maiorica SM1 TaxID=1265738 RepID=M5RW12_9BACT|nr:hypothetical protein [Rhodopirellula maiorica]EMI19587.1 hypothetical protein RMSM_03492 [Rhodopirellula maiorica SM1]
MRVWLYSLLLVPFLLGCSDGGNRVVDTSNRPPREPVSEEEMDALMSGDAMEASKP